MQGENQEAIAGNVTVSVVVPMLNEVAAVDALVDEVEAALADRVPFELILVDDGSTDGTGQRIDTLRESRPWLRRIAHAKPAGQSAAVHTGVSHARAGLICTLDGDGQNPPGELPRILQPFLDDDADPGLGLIAGQRTRRRDTLSKRLASRAANAIRTYFLNDATRDTGCGLKAFRRDAFLKLPYFNHMHRYLPALFARDGWRVGHVDVAHRERHGGLSKYTNLGRALVGIYDLIGVAWLIRRRNRAVVLGEARHD